MHRLPLFAALLLLQACDATPRADEYTLRIYANEQELGVVALTVDADVAIANAGSVSERFDLKNQRWQQDETKQWVTMAECKEWQKNSEEKTRRSQVSVPAEMRSFIAWTLNPIFKVEEDNQTLRLTSGHVDYVIVADKAEADVTSYFRYARLNAYKKVMTGASKFPIYPELKVLDELERRKLLPASMEIRIPAVKGAPRLRIEIIRKAR